MVSKNMTGGQALIHCLYQEGVRVIFGLPGVQMYHAVIPIIDYPDLKFITTRHEQATTYMADGYSRASGNVGVAMVVPGPGLQNASAGITNAYASSSPVLLISGQIARDRISKDIGVLHEINDQLDVIRPITKWQQRIMTASEVADSVKESFYQLRTGRPRPVEIEIPPEALSESIEEIREYQSDSVPILGADGSVLEEAASVMAHAKNPVIWAGGGVNIADASKELLRLAEYLQVPVMTTPEGKGSISDDHYLSLGTPQGRSTGQSKDLLRDFFYESDVILAVGTRFATANPRDSQRVIQIDVDPVEIGRNNNNTIGIVADAKVGLTELLDAIKPLVPAKNSREEEFDKIRATRYAWDNQVQPQASYVRALRESIPADGILVTDMTIMAYYSRAYYLTYNPRTYITSSYSGNLGSAFPTALGVKVAQPDKAVISISGDGGFLFNSQELATAVQFGINVVAVVFNDQSYGNVKRDMKELFNGKSLGVQLQNPDFMKLADAYGVVGIKAETPEELSEAIRHALTLNCPVLIEAPVGEMPSPF